MDDPGCAALLSDLRALLHDWFLRYADPDRDGAGQPVYGMGQLGPVGRRSNGEPAFNGDIWYVDGDGKRRKGPDLSPMK